MLNQLAILQHFGAPTRLIDITFNAWVALWFATEHLGQPENDEADGRIFCIDISQKSINENVEFRDWEDSLHRPWKNLDAAYWGSHVYAWKPANIDARIASQNGAFLVGGVPTSSKCERSINKDSTYSQSTNTPQQFRKSGKAEDGFWKIGEVRKSTSIAIRPHVFNKASDTSNGSCFTFVISSKIKSEIRNRLDKQFGYSHRVIYPDYTGFARYAGKIV